MKHIFDPRIILALGGLFFAIAYIDSLRVQDYAWNCFYDCLHFIGKAAIVGFFLSMAWLIVTTLGIVKRK